MLRFTYSGLECVGSSARDSHAAWALIFTRLWATTPCPVHVLAPSVPSMRLRYPP